METLILCAVYVPLSTTLISIISFEDMQFQFVFRHFTYQLLEDEDEDLTQLIFGPHSPVMKKAIIFLTITIIIISLIGSAFELRKWIRDRAKIVEGKDLGKVRQVIPTGESARNFCEGVLLQPLILAKKMRLTLKVTCCTFVFLLIFLAGRPIRSYLTQLTLSC